MSARRFSLPPRPPHRGSRAFITCQYLLYLFTPRIQRENTSCRLSELPAECRLRPAGADQEKGKAQLKGCQEPGCRGPDPAVCTVARAAVRPLLACLGVL